MPELPEVETVARDLRGLVVGAHGAMVEVHPAPEHALSDGAQSLHFREFEKLLGKLKKLEVYARKNL
jgi:3-deoxy-D-arabino-heptulosonate 7-phosphate (DAHP) synthase